MDYKDTINLPNTAFPMKANLANREPQMLKHGRKAAFINGSRNTRPTGHCLSCTMALPMPTVIFILVTR